MTGTVPVIGVAPAELCWLRMLIALLRHPDPAVPELTRQALLYLSDAADKPLHPLSPSNDTLDPAG